MQYQCERNERGLLSHVQLWPVQRLQRLQRLQPCEAGTQRLQRRCAMRDMDHGMRRACADRVVLSKAA